MTRSSSISGGLPRVHPAFEFLCTALRFARGAETAEGLRRGAAPVTDWNIVLRGARAHRVTVALHRALLALPDDNRPHAAAEAVTRRRRKQAVVALERAAELAALSADLASAGIRALVLKGVPLSLELYGDIDARGVGDIDFLVDPADFRRTAERLQDHGYRPVQGDLDHFLGFGGGMNQRELVLRHATRPSIVEIQQRFTLNPTRLETRFDTLWRGRKIGRVGEAEIATLPDEMLAPYLCVHGADHCWERLIWLEDIARLAQARGGPAELLAQAEAHGLGRPMALALTLGAEWLSLQPLPDRRAAKDACRFVRNFFDGEFALSPPPETGFRALRRRWHRRLYLLNLKDGWRARMDEIRAVFADPFDWNGAQVSTRLGWLYFAIRPIRMTWRALRDLVR
jgi:hypothetical protein